MKEHRDNVWGQTQCSCVYRFHNAVTLKHKNERDPTARYLAAAKIQHWRSNDLHLLQLPSNRSHKLWQYFYIPFPCHFRLQHIPQPFMHRGAQIQKSNIFIMLNKYNHFISMLTATSTCWRGVTAMQTRDARTKHKARSRLFDSLLDWLWETSTLSLSI